MNRPKPAIATLVILYGLLVALVMVTYPKLPERVATHFGFSGEPDGWMSRPACAAFTLGVAALTALICAGSTYLARFFTDSAINIPNRAYWLAPERRRETYDKIFSLGLWIACLTTALFLAFHMLVVRANQANPVRLPTGEGCSLLLVFLAGIGGIIWFSVTRSWQAPSEDAI
ncbi:DUF1648 domain-containing protein [Singulisphaera acidiphila]|uniref:DUF1648 domain-containing protein n=1 Tax=Singulisphaera acidiphila (strain ATCC BAA-1392 / DSM 18658 / VKM B-2454 / MOB10) TaxID=886293 RepID=L0D5S6_SINAD|nr:DUF1648 domain-containing protein [Singulisphaera acidiphila]AGA24612.1 Protein of unknown function (DUF1648) [Singulisphaera acidiphila DSM 18658]